MPITKALIPVALAAALALVQGCGNSSEDLQKRAAAAEQAGDMPTAILEMKSAVQQAPQDALLRFNLGRLYNKAFDFVGAEKEFDKALELGHQDQGQLVLELARAYRGQGKFEELLQKIETSPAFDTSNQASIIALRGRAQHYAGDVAAAAQSLEQARALEPDNADAALLQAQIDAGKGDLVAALASIDKLLDRAPDNFDAWTYRAELLRALDRVDDALAAYNKVLKMDPRNFVALYNRSALLLGLGRLDDAADAARKMRQLYKDQPDAIVQEGVVQLAQGKSREALDAAQTSLQLAPNFAKGLLLAGLANHRLNQLEQADEMLTAYLAARPANLMAQRALADTAIKLGQSKRALEILTKALEEHAGDARLLVLAGDASIALGDKTKAAEFYDKAAAAKPDDDAIALRRAFANFGGGKSQEDLAELQAALSTVKQASGADEELIRTLLVQGQVDQAWDALLGLEKRAPDSPITHNLRGAILATKGDRTGAVAAFEAALAANPKFLPAARNLARLDMAAGNKASARGRFESVLAADAKNVPALLALAELETGLGERDSAVKTLRRALEIAPDSLLANKRLVALLVAQGKNQDAAESADKALAASKFDTQLVILAAAAHEATGNTNQAEKIIKRLISQNPASDWAYVRVAQFQAKAGRASDAEATLREGLGINERSPSLQIALSSLLVAQGQVEQAMDFAKHVQQAQPKAPVGYVLEGEIHESQQAYAEAVKSYESALKLQPVGQLAIKIYAARSKAGDEPAALAWLEDWAARNEADMPSRVQIGNARLARGDYKGAVANFEKVVASGQVPVDVLNALAYSYQKLKDERALPYAEAAFRAAPRSGMIADTLGWILFEQAQTERALGILRQAVALAPNEPEIRYHLAAALARSGDKESARAELETALKAEGTFAWQADARKLRESL